MVKPFAIDLKKEFVKLPHAPIVEAVLQWDVVPTIVLNEQVMRTAFESAFEGYSVTSQHQHRLDASFSGESPSLSMNQVISWDGLRFTSNDGMFVCQLKPHSVIFSQLKPYADWNSFVKAAFPFWEQFKELVQPVSVERLGVRFISQIELSDSNDVSKYIQTVSSPLNGIGLESESFFHQDTVEIPAHPYQIRLVRALQPPQLKIPPCPTLIVDIDVTTTGVVSLDAIEKRLNEMRFLKNEVFFAYMKDAEKNFK